MSREGACGPLIGPGHGARAQQLKIAEQQREIEVLREEFDAVKRALAQLT
ncbi:MAG TPA: hypothetical protein VF132_02455 [Rudaea sp.]|jgi:hypothetical protein